MAPTRNRTGSRSPLREAQKQLTRERLVEAAVDVIGRDGHAATVEDIAAAAGASRATFYIHFKSRTEILRELHATVLYPQAQDFYAALESMEAPTREKLRAWLARSVELWQENERVINVVLQELEDDEESPPRTKGTVTVNGHLARYLVARGFDRRNARVRAKLLTSQLRGFLQGWGRFAEGEREPLLDLLAEQWLLVIEKPPAPQEGKASPRRPRARS